jgi:hypothetical protein
VRGEAVLVSAGKDSLPVKPEEKGRLGNSRRYPCAYAFPGEGEYCAGVAPATSSDPAMEEYEGGGWS